MRLFIELRKVNTGQYPVCRASPPIRAASDVALDNSARLIVRVFLSHGQWAVDLRAPDWSIPVGILQGAGNHVCLTAPMRPEDKRHGVCTGREQCETQIIDE